MLSTSGLFDANRLGQSTSQLYRASVPGSTGEQERISKRRLVRWSYANTWSPSVEMLAEYLPCLLEHVTYRSRVLTRVLSSVRAFPPTRGLATVVIPPAARLLSGAGGRLRVEVAGGEVTAHLLVRGLDKPRILENILDFVRGSVAADVF